MLIFAGGQIDKNENKVLYERHNKHIIEPLVKTFKDVTCVRFIPDVETFTTSLLLEKESAKVVQMDSNLTERVGVVRYDYK